MIFVLACFSLGCAALPTVMYLANRRWFLMDDDGHPETTDTTPVSVLIPARNEAARIGATIQPLLDSDHQNLEIVILDDQSEDATADVVRRFAHNDARVRLIAGAPLPKDWNGKQFACYQLAEAAANEVILFLDADVHLQPTAIDRLLATKSRLRVALLSAFPKQMMGTIAEKAMVPLMHYILLGFLPFARMRQSVHPAYASGCGQLFLTTKTAYQTAGTHAAIRRSRHDGIKLPKAYRLAGLSTDVVDGSRMATCRMYEGTREVVRGVLKNADEGIANAKAILPFSVFLLGSTLLPLVLLTLPNAHRHGIVTVLACLALVIVHIPRLLSVRDLHQPVVSGLLHIPSVSAFVLLQWVAFSMSLLGKKVKWKNRL